MYGRKGRYIFQSHGAYTLENEHFEPENLSFEIGKSSEPILQIWVPCQFPGVHQPIKSYR